MKAKLVDGFTGLFVATPCMGSVDEAYFQSGLKTLGLLMENHIPVEWPTLCDTYISSGRNDLVAQFMASKCSHLLFIDSDMGWEPTAVTRLLTIPHDLIVGAYLKKIVGKREYTLNWLPDCHMKLNQCEYGCIEIAEGPTGFMRISREAIQKMMDAYPELAYEMKAVKPLGVAARAFGLDESKRNIRTLYALFDFELGPNREKWGDDFAFCRRWKAIGGKVWLDPTAKLDHYGRAKWEGDVTELLGNIEEEKELASVTGIEGWFSEGQAAVLRKLIAKLPDKPTVVELGAWKGRSTVVIGKATKERDGEFWSIDHWKGSPEGQESYHKQAAENPGSVLEEYLTNLAQSGLSDFVQVVDGDLFEAVNDCEDACADLIFFDAEHSIEATANAFKAWEPKLKPGGVAVFHDANWRTVQVALAHLGISEDCTYTEQLAIWDKPRAEGVTDVIPSDVCGGSNPSSEETVFNG
jgi:predicted O-methyltransferase YrrM